MTEEFRHIKFRTQGRVGVITLNRPEKRNAWTGRMRDEIGVVVTKCNADPEIGAVLIHGEGRDYCAGADMGGFQNEIAARDGGSDVDAARLQQLSIPDLFSASLPIVCAIHGNAIGVGITHALVADVRIAGESARFGLTFVKVGIVPELSSSHYFPQLVGLSNAMRWMLTGDLFDAQEAYRMGLVAAVVPDERLFDEAMAIAEKIAANPKQQLGWTKKLLLANHAQQNAAIVPELEASYMAMARRSPEHKEAVAAFMEKRPPNFVRR